MFAFTYKGQQYNWIRLPRGFINSPTLFSRCLQDQLSTLKLKMNSTLVQKVDDLFVASKNESSIQKDTAQLLNHLADLGYVVSPSKVLVAQEKVTILGIIISATERSLEKSRLEPICGFSIPIEAKQMRKRLGMVMQTLDSKYSSRN